VAEELAGTTENPVASTRDDAGIGSVLATTGAIRLRGVPRPEPAAAPRLGEHTDTILESLR
jgi:crotonobetainyl-CoA:carnitine CoA-transferase CaiB-like acyl-CoA transferase